ncbi:MAG: ribosome assembly cofactor RimP [Flavobacteriia bacterium]|jgi:ribosome maturation factor RimP|nr:ribosome assembly cofactor RimP [Flavobacteriia bacterium]NDD50106.1 ribosome assembly cofactor RimP [Flavobacteriia bacterium]
MTQVELETLVQQELAACGAFLVEFSMNADNQIRVYADMVEGHISIDQLKKLSRAVEGALGEDSENYSIEVSSPGMFAPFKVPAQFAKHIGRQVKVNRISSGTSLKGTLERYDGETITLHWTERVPKPSGKGKVTVDVREELALSDVSKIVLEFKF